MGKTKNAGLGIGTTNVPQGGLTQSNVEIKANVLAKESMLDELKKVGVKYNADEVIFVIHDKTGQMLWLEEGNDGAGLKHILNNHAADFKKAFGVKPDEIGAFLSEVISQGIVYKNEVKHINGIDGYERIYKYKTKYYLLVGIGLNGFIVSAYPIGGID